MKKHKPDLKSTLKQKVPLQKHEKDITSIQSGVQEIHNSKKDEILTTIHLPKDIHKKIKIYCVANGLSIKDYITQKLIDGIE